MSGHSEASPKFSDSARFAGGIAQQAGFAQYFSAPTAVCAPPVGTEHHEFHWLAFVGDAPQFPYRTSCELWRWSAGQWRSVFVPGSRFTPEELTAQGWRYCKPCEPLVAVVRS
jgi:hypothetical protein